jgi:uncharacterized membrane protein
MGKFFNQIKQYKLIFYAIGILLLIAILGYLIADASWDNVMDTLTATEVPTLVPTSTPTPISAVIGIHLCM